MDFVTTLVYFLNIGLFSALVARFTGAVLSALVFCSLLYMGATPIETIGMMLTYLVFMRLTIYTQRNRVNFKKMQVFTGMKIVPAIALILIFLISLPVCRISCIFTCVHGRSIIKNAEPDASRKENELQGTYALHHSRFCINDIFYAPC
ncbi:MAG: hypothetical protein ACLR1D_05370 [Dialister sp.]